ncbi:MAG: cyclic nucleotide-binding domain-containing protein [Candidatus Hydrogenedentes bacterium]|nr:cyclic nucleotide-binding domain-containing protein [Candidatus Hydrogenedentota bacterium]
MDSQQVRQAILKLRFMGGLESDLRAKVAELIVRVAEQRSVPKGGIFIHEHEPNDDRGFVLLSGRILVQKTGSPDTTCEAPEILGEMQQFNPTHLRTATISGDVPCVVLRFHWSAFWNAVNQELQPPQIEALRKALEMNAWEHFIN